MSEEFRRLVAEEVAKGTPPQIARHRALRALEAQAGAPSATSKTDAHSDGIDRAAAWKRALKRASADARGSQPSNASSGTTTPADAHSDGIDRAAAWKRALKRASADARGSQPSNASSGTTTPADAHSDGIDRAAAWKRALKRA
ncbi:hypothetical protein [Mesorhizobium xinjiangense]|uniref:hypothetical protein n=1 Tax=Mesorhizobium xinjiangense TaxID=2678685 RepID=UPI0012EEAA35|nr:hypothetical protein [Mesorhizobium xinjiangense]